MDTASTDTHPTAGWYTDPHNPTRLRLWNGHGWEHDTTTITEAISAHHQRGRPPVRRHLVVWATIATLVVTGVLTATGITATGDSTAVDTSAVGSEQPATSLPPATTVPSDIPPQTVPTTQPPVTVPPTQPPVTAPPAPTGHPSPEAAIAAWTPANMGGATLVGRCPDVVASPQTIGQACWAVSNSGEYLVGFTFSEYVYAVDVTGDPGSGWLVTGARTV